MSPGPKRGILLVNLGSPDSPSVSDVRRYLGEFLMDPRVIDVPWLIRAAIVYGFILPFRPRKSAEAYEKIWTETGSPLVSISASVQRRLSIRTGLPVELGMRYQNPTIEAALSSLIAAGVNDVLVAPLFPHHAKSSYESAAERVKQVAARIAKAGPQLRLTVLPPYYDRAEYIGALVASASAYLEREHDHLLLSFHGIPQRHVVKANRDCGECLNQGHCTGAAAESRVCYKRHCLETVKRFVAASGLAPDRVSFAFQSRLGVDRWLAPGTHNEIVRLAGAGVRKLVVMCPAFTVDCLETIEEIGMRAREVFLASGGEEFTLVPCLNDQPAWIEALARMADGAAMWPMTSEQAGLLQNRN